MQDRQLSPGNPHRLVRIILEEVIVSQVSLICPACHTLLQTGAGQHICPSCRQIYPHTLGIPDLCGPEAQSSPVETAVVARLCELYPTATFEELNWARISAYQDFYSVDEELLEHYRQYNSALQTRGQRFHQMFRAKLAQHLSAPRLGLALNIGCGTGAGTAAIATEFEHVAGLDINMPSLIVAKKLIESQGLSNVTLVQGSALCLPFLDRSFDYTIAINVLEHIFEPAAMLDEVYRVLATDGVFGGDSRNRFDLFFPEPHVKLRWVGFLPRRWMSPYVRWRIGDNYNQTYLLSFGDLRRALQTAFGREWRIVLPKVSAYGASARVERLIDRASRIGPLCAILTRLSPTYLALARRVV